MSVQVTQPAPDFKAVAVMPDNTFNEKFQISDYKGKYVELFGQPTDNNARVRLRASLLPLLPQGTAILPLAEAATIGQNASGLATTFGFAALVILLVLAAQFESFVSAAIIMVTVPFGLACAVYALLLTGSSLNVYSQIGLVLLVGITLKSLPNWLAAAMMASYATRQWALLPEKRASVFSSALGRGSSAVVIRWAMRFA